MNLSQIDILLKARTNAQAINLGFVTARRYKIALLTASFLSILPFFVIAVMLTLWFDLYAWASLLLWWCKPFYDRVILDNASRLLFREPLTLPKQIESLGRACKNGLWLNLTLYRFSPIRHVTIPVFLLERLRGKDYQKRVKFVAKGSSSSATMSLIGFVHVEMVLYLNCYLLLAMFLPDSLKGNDLKDFFRMISEIDNGILAVGFLFLQLLCMMVVEIFFVMTGFMIYLNNRVKTEGWDIELGFKQMASRLAAVRQILPGVVLAITLAMSMTGAVSKQAIAASEAPTTVTLTPKGDKETLKQIILDNDLMPYRQETTWERKTPYKKEPTSDYRFDGFGDLSAIANIIKFSLVILALFILYWLVINREKFADFFQSNTKIPQDNAPSIMFGLDIRRETLPKDIAAEARRLLQSGDKTAALSLLYRGSLSLLVSDYQIKITESDTEGDCLAATEEHVGKTIYHYFKQVTLCWQQMVYAHHSVEKAMIEQLIEQWKSTFAVAKISSSLISSETP